MKTIFRGSAKIIGCVIMAAAFLQWITFDYPSANPFWPGAILAPGMLSQVLNWLLVCVLATVGWGFYTLGKFKIEKKSKDAKTQITSDTATAIVQAYGEILETSAPAPGCVADESKLPYSKKEIKKAIIAGLRSTDNTQLKEHLKVGYIRLADWQQNVGESHQGLDLSNVDLSQDIEVLAKIVSDQTSGADDWVSVVQKEQEALKKELLELGLW